MQVAFVFKEKVGKQWDASSKYHSSGKMMNLQLGKRIYNKMSKA
jgi:hypothetical protein